MTFDSLIGRGKAVCAVAALSAACLVQPALAPFAGTVPARAQSGPQSLADLSDQLIDSVVNISTSQRLTGGERDVPRPRLPEGSPFQEFFDDFFDSMPHEGPGQPGSRRVQSLGSGFVIDAEQGIVVTNNHVIADADEVVVNFHDGSSLDAEIIGTDPQTDLAVLRIDPSGKPDIVAVPIGDSDAMRVGDWVLAIGNPFGLGGSVSVGIVSAFGRNINSGPYDNFIQTDAAINRGNSGGPLFNMDGEVIGINTAIISPSGGSIGIGFAIPTELAAGVIDQLRQFGETRRGWLGVRIQEVTDDIAESLGMDEAIGALVAGIIDGGPVDDGSIEPGDVIIEFDGKPVETMRELPRVVAETPVGKQVDVVVLRNGEQQRVQVTLGRLKDNDQLASAAAPDAQAPEPAGIDLFGMTLRPLTDAERETFDVSDQVAKGVIVTAIEEGSAAADRGVNAGDVIVEINQEVVATPADVEGAIDRLRQSDRRNALLMLAGTDGALRFVTIRID